MPLSYLLGENCRPEGGERMALFQMPVKNGAIFIWLAFGLRI
jgi:hypothetical protein